MTDDQVKQGFDEVYNQFWRKYKQNIPERNSQEWERIHTYVVVLQKKYPFLRQTVLEMEIELDKRMREIGNALVTHQKPHRGA